MTRLRFGDGSPFRFGGTLGGFPGAPTCLEFPFPCAAGSRLGGCGWLGAQQIQRRGTSKQVRWLGAAKTIQNGLSKTASAIAFIILYLILLHKAAMGWQPGCHAPALIISSKQLVRKLASQFHSHWFGRGLDAWEFCSADEALSSLQFLASCPSGSFVGLQALEDGDEAWGEDGIWNTIKQPLRFDHSNGSTIPNSWTWRKLIHHISFFMKPYGYVCQLQWADCSGCISLIISLVGVGLFLASVVCIPCIHPSHKTKDVYPWAGG